MKIPLRCIYIVFIIMIVYGVISAQSKDTTVGYIIRHKAQIGKIAPGPHDGTGKTIGYRFFDDITDFKLFLCFREQNDHVSLIV